MGDVARTFLLPGTSVERAPGNQWRRSWDSRVLRPNTRSSLTILSATYISASGPTYGNQAMSRKNVFKQYVRFRDGRQRTEDDSRPRPSLKIRIEENVQKNGRNSSKLSFCVHQDNRGANRNS
ncbi:hypothetical protein J437_LFUL001064 [Ladona fulva]|uniref:Uncharacterized protein n=1 Tax=Ladona fulva TaxID=123851 RepID=A0A8K0P152_LADFU|nr:hypothetical protein J437_LFUL001064 [Ladona fulva]